MLARCALAPGTTAKPNTTVLITLELQADGTWRVKDVNCAAPVRGAREVTGDDVRDAVRTLVPGPRIGVAPPGGVTLVHMQTLLWIDTTVDRSLDTVQLLGHPVTIDIHLDHVTWTFGDTTTDTTDTPGKPYTATDPCTTATCPNYYGHTYRDTGTRHLTATATWTGRYRIADGAWQPIPGTVTGPTMTSTLTVRQARGILVPDSADH